MDQSGGAAGMVVSLMMLGVLGLMLASGWKLFSKAGRPGWGALVPIYNVYLLLKIVGKPAWWLVLFFIPVVNLVVGILVAVALSSRFGKGAGYAVGLILLPIVFYPLLAFGDAQYQPPTEAQS
jgi:hypothetical protein